MAETEIRTKKKIQMRHRGRISQVNIYFGKFVRIFIYQNDWKVLPMAAVIAGMVSLVIRHRFRLNMEGTLMGALALACVAIWNGCFNSIQAICRERSIIKREHRSGMHVSAYVTAHVLFQAIICLLQTGITLYVCGMAGVRLGGEGLFTSFMILDMGITIFLITFASDMVSLFISGIVHSPTTAMTIMPFVLIFQLVFSGGFFTLPDRLQGISAFTISHYGLKCIAAQGHYNELPLASGWDTLYRMRGSEINEDITVGQAIDFALTNESDPAKDLRDTPVTDGVTVGQILADYQKTPAYEQYQNESFNVRFTIGDVIDLIGKERLKEAVTEKGREAAQNSEYKLSYDNIMECWINLAGFALLFALLTIISLEFIDRDKR